MRRRVVDLHLHPRRGRADFVALMDGPDLPQPRLVDIAVPANRNPGLPHGV